MISKLFNKSWMSYVSGGSGWLLSGERRSNKCPSITFQSFCTSNNNNKEISNKINKKSKYKHQDMVVKNDTSNLGKINSIAILSISYSLL